MLVSSRQASHETSVRRPIIDVVPAETVIGRRA